MASEILTLLESSLSSSERSRVSLHILEFVSETVAANIEDGVTVSKDDAVTILLDAGLGDLDEETLHDIASTVEVVTGGGTGDVGSNGDEMDADIDDGTCEMCERYLRRTFHHLIPKETHNKYLKKKQLPANIPCNGEDAVAKVSRLWLNTYGIMICSTCHSAIHRAVPNDILAEEYNSLDLLLTHPKIYAFAKYNSKQPVRQKFTQQKVRL
eukprot:CAMPEP_0185018668 /NCGR_PEP_ID=MMETSP1103-20130426/1324_1 /TAXON_ID=36769 /ORGANISM="Paraphysomonas bandaiensis, Strain Caron Lab Isolate" /LENGTH=211 /DNA_ID=CAMNT_0027548561 /DNA_START=82 /DNA_END=717 /DNA_ORIENTATION=-